LPMTVAGGVSMRKSKLVDLKAKNSSVLSQVFTMLRLGPGPQTPTQ
jgi:hypothetical protein